MISGRINLPGILPGEIVVSEAELRLVEKLATIGRAVLDAEQAHHAVEAAVGYRDDAENTVKRAVRAAKEGGVR